MKPPTQEREGFGTSAIDLFASGMGAFILIALVFMVLFAATPRSEEPPAPVAPAALCPTPEPCPEAPACPTCLPPTVCPEPPEPACPACPTPEPTVCPPAPPCPTLTCPEQPACPACPVCPEPREPAPTPAPPAPAQSCPQPAPQTTLLPETDIVFVLDTTGSMYREIESLKRELHILVEVLERMMPSVGIGVVTFNDRLQRPPSPPQQFSFWPDAAIGVVFGEGGRDLTT